MNRDPFILASGPPTRNAEMISRAFDIGWNGAVTKTICLNHEDMVEVAPRIHRVNNGLKNIELISPRSVEEWVEDVRFLKSKYPEKTVIASISAEAGNIAAWQKLALMMQDAGSDALELNFSCPHGLPEKNMGNTCSDIPEAAGLITKSVKQVSKIPVWVKLSPNVTSISYLAQVCVGNGADCITAINTVKGFAGVDIETGKPILSTYGGISGQTIKPIALKAVSEIASLVKCPVSAAGGISTWQDAVEFILLGASTVQICTEVMLSGYEIIHNLSQGLADYLGMNTLDNIRGTSLKYVTSFYKLDNTYKVISEIDFETCTKCEKCYISCRDAGYQAIDICYKIDKEKCTGCGLCSAVCPAECIKVTPVILRRANK
ncbi:MAG: hypothetical protein A2Y25_00575 [Candidatus Melainabacteria bacterium GWF2_37_15]|nr:MAG: hypothetical protein A2Y25_00575 [Candidatus Melainabacteria bacterium GWF2_37_15]